MRPIALLVGFRQLLKRVDVHRFADEDFRRRKGRECFEGHALFGDFFAPLEHLEHDFRFVMPSRVHRGVLVEAAAVMAFVGQLGNPFLRLLRDGILTSSLTDFDKVLVPIERVPLGVLVSNRFTRKL